MAQRLRGHAILSRGWAGPEDLIDGREVDADDARAVHLLAFRGETPVGTCRLLCPAPGRPLALDGPSGETRLPEDAAHLGRIVVIDPEPHAGRSVAAALIGRAWLEVRAHGSCRIAGLASAPMLRLLRRMGFTVRVVGPPVHWFGEDRVPMLFEPETDHRSLAARYLGPTAS